MRKVQNTVIDLSTHLAVSLLLALFFYWITEGWIWPVLAIVGGILIDLDHFIDYFLFFGWKLDLKDFFASRYLASGRIYLLFHSWELMAVLWFCSVFFSWMVPVAAGATLHLLVDFFYSHRLKPLFLFLSYRWYNGFRLDKIDPEHYKFVKSGGKK